MKANLKRRLESLEQRSVGDLTPRGTFCVVVGLTFGTPDLAASTCRRTLLPNGTLQELVEFRDASGNMSGRDGLTDEELRRWMNTFR